jgi:O-antigen/teichoic acid export membrane protein
MALAPATPMSEPERPLQLRQQVLIGLAWSMLQIWGSRILTFVVFVVLARLLEPADFGSVTLGYVIFATLATLPEGGLSDVLIRRPHNEPGHLDTAFWAMLGGATLLYAATAVGAPYVARALDQPRLTGVLLLLGLTLPLNASGLVHEALLRRSMNFRPLAMRTLVATSVGGVVAIALAFAGFGYWSLVVKGLFDTAVGTILLWRASPYRPRLQVSWRCWTELFAVSRYLLLSRVLDLANTRADSLIVGARLGSEALGLYAAAQRIHSMMMEALFATVNRVTLPAFSKINHDPLRMGQGLLRLVSFCSFFTVPLFAAVAVMAEPIVLLLFGERWRDAAPLLSAFGFGGVLFSVSFFNAPVMTAAGRTGLVLTLTVVNGALNLLGFFIGSFWGALGVAIAFSLRGYLVLPLNLVFLRRSIGLSSGTYLKALWPSYAAAAIAFGAVFAIHRALPLGWPLLAQLIVPLAAAPLLYAATMLVFFPRRTMAVLGEIEQWRPDWPRLTPAIERFATRTGRGPRA